MNSLTSTTTSAISLSNILVGAIITISALIVLLALDELMSRWSDSWNAHTSAARRLQMIAAFIPNWRDSFNANRSAVLKVIYVPLVVTFFACVVFTIAHAL